MKLRIHAATMTVSCALAIVPAVLLPAAPAIAQSCASLKSELSQLQSKAARTSPGAKKWQSAKRQQQKALSAAERDVGYLGCGSSSSPECKTLTKKVKRMKSNLRAIERQLAKAGGVAPNTKKRIRQVQAALKRQDCGNKANVREASTRRDNSATPRSLLARLFNPKQAEEQPSDTASSKNNTRKRTKVNSKRRGLPSGGTFRTLCVRTCDGYFFPVSFSTGKRQFANDAARCNEICPASETELYVYRNPGGDQANMMSLAGFLYTEQPFAYRYKEEFVEGCSCRQARQKRSRSAWTELRGGNGSRSRIFFTDISSGLPSASSGTAVHASSSTISDLPSPLARIPLTKDQLPLHEDPDTLANLEKGFDVTAALARVATRVASSKAAQSIAGTTGELPLLGGRTRPENESLETASIPPVFKKDDPGFRPAPDRDAPVRVVGPEYFVAQ